ncbi:hypothetical protein, partial [Serratia marcescens]
YKTSSIIWRIKGDYKKEFEYASILKGMAIDVRYSHTEYAIFINRRCDYISDNREIFLIEKKY